LNRARRIAAQVVGFLLGASLVRAGGPPPPTEPPEVFYRVSFPEPGTNHVDVEAWSQYARPDSLDLWRWAPAFARIRRVEAHVSAEAVVLNACDREARRYRAEVPRGAPLEWAYTAELAPADTMPQAYGAAFACFWLGSVLLAPARSDVPNTPAVVKLLLEARLPQHWQSVGPWRVSKGMFAAPTVAGLFDDFIGCGAFRTRLMTVASPACTLQVAAAPGLQDSLGAAQLAALAAHFGPGPATVFLVPGRGAARAFVAHRSALVVCGAARDAMASFDAAWPQRRRSEHWHAGAPSQ
jgi:hypothetical protein